MSQNRITRLMLTLLVTLFLSFSPMTHSRCNYHPLWLVWVSLMIIMYNADQATVIVLMVRRCRSWLRSSGWWNAQIDLNNLNWRWLFSATAVVFFCITCSCRCREQQQPSKCFGIKGFSSKLGLSSVLKLLLYLSIYLHRRNLKVTSCNLIFNCWSHTAKKYLFLRTVLMCWSKCKFPSTATLTTSIKDEKKNKQTL